MKFENGNVLISFSIALLGFNVFFYEDLIGDYIAYQGYPTQLLYAQNQHIIPALGEISLIFLVIITAQNLGSFKMNIICLVVLIVSGVVITLTVTDALHPPKVSFYVLHLILEVLVREVSTVCFILIISDQFVLHDETQQKTFENWLMLIIWLENLAQVFYFSIQSYIEPDNECFGMDKCYTVLFGVYTFLMVIVLAIFLSGTHLYSIKPPQKKIVLKMVDCIKRGFSNYLKSDVYEEHWLDHARDKYNDKFIDKVKRVLSIILVILPLPFYNMVYSQQNSTFQLQTKKLNGHLGTLVLLTDLIPLLKCITVVTLIPVFVYIIFPLSKKFYFLHTPLQRMGLAYIMILISFIWCTVISAFVDKTDVVLPKDGYGQLRIYNNINKDVEVLKNIIDRTSFNMKKLSFHKVMLIPVLKSKKVNYVYKIDGVEYSTILVIEEEKAIGYYFNGRNNLVKFEDEIDKDLKYSYAKFKVLIYTNNTISYSLKEIHNSKSISGNSNNITTKIIPPGYYSLYVNKIEQMHCKFKMGGVYTILIDAMDTKNIHANIITVTIPNTVHVFWQIFQYFFFAIGEILFTYTWYVFLCHQSPNEMRVVVLGIWKFFHNLGDIIVVLIEFISVDKMTFNCIIYCTLLGMDILFFIWVAVKYEYITNTELLDQEKKEDDLVSDHLIHAKISLKKVAQDQEVFAEHYHV